jgi:hypothetical protein
MPVMPTTLYTPEIDYHGAGHDEAFAETFDRHLIITVIHTAPEGTLSALKTAYGLAKCTGLQMRLVATHEVPFRLSLEQPMVSTDFLRGRQANLVAQAKIDPEEVFIQILLCRNGRRALSEFLIPHSLVAIGGSRRWWKPERRLEKYLTRSGHRVVFVETHRRNHATAFLHRQHCR